MQPRLFLALILTIFFVSCQKSGVPPVDDITPIDSSNNVNEDSSNNPNGDSLMLKGKISTIVNGYGISHYHYTLHYNSKGQLSQLTAPENQRLIDFHYDSQGKLISYSTGYNPDYGNRDSVVYNAKGQVSTIISYYDQSSFFPTKTLYYNSIGKVETIINQFHPEDNDSLHFDYDADSNLIRFEEWASRGTGRELTAEINFYEYDKNINPFHGLVPEGVVLWGISYYEDHEGDEYLQFSNHNVGSIENRSWFTYRIMYYNFDSFGRVIAIANNTSFRNPFDFITYH